MRSLVVLFWLVHFVFNHVEVYPTSLRFQLLLCIVVVIRMVVVNYSIDEDRSLG